MRSLWLHQAVAGKLVVDPGDVLGKARENLQKLRDLHPRAQRYLAEWSRLLNGPVDEILRALTSVATWAVELRQNTPFAGVLTDGERASVVREFQKSHRSRR